MGYESRIYVMDRVELGKLVFAERIAVIDMCCMGYDSGFKELFDKPIDYKLFINGDDWVDTDCYDEHIKYTSIPKVIEWLENEIERESYRRLKPLLGLLSGFDESEWTDLQVVHYGY